MQEPGATAHAAGRPAHALIPLTQLLSSKSAARPCDGPWFHFENVHLPVLQVAFFICHFAACIFYFIARQYGFSDTTWIGANAAEVLDGKSTFLRCECPNPPGYWSILPFVESLLLAAKDLTITKSTRKLLCTTASVVCFLVGLTALYQIVSGHVRTPHKRLTAVCGLHHGMLDQGMRRLGNCK